MQDQNPQIPKNPKILFSDLSHKQSNSSQRFYQWKTLRSTLQLTPMQIGS